MIVNLIEPAFPVPQMTQDIVGRDGLPVIGSDGSKSQIVIEVSNLEPDTISTPKLEAISKTKPETISKPKPKTMNPNP